MRERAIVVWFDKKRGFGFLKGTDGPDVFVHFAGICGKRGQRNLQADQVVEFTRVTQNGKPNAIAVVVVDAPLTSCRQKAVHKLNGTNGSTPRKGKEENEIQHS